jgi:hypothetical protein
MSRPGAVTPGSAKETSRTLTPSRSAAACRAAARGGSRTATVACVRPSPAHRGQCGAGGRACAQDERCRGTAPGQRREGPRAAGRSGQALGQRRDHARDVSVMTLAAAGVEDHRVGRADLGHQRPGFVEQGQHRALGPHGQGQPGPVRSAPSDRGRQAGFAALDRLISPAVQAQRLVPRTVQHRRQRVSDRRTENCGLHDRGVQPEPVREPVPPPVLPYLATAWLKAVALVKNSVLPDFESMVRKNR